MKDVIKSVRFSCNAYYKPEGGSSLERTKCLGDLTVTGTEREIEEQYRDAGWSYPDSSEGAMKTYFHVCKTHYLKRNAT